MYKPTIGDWMILVLCYVVFSIPMWVLITNVPLKEAL